jgi:dTDP-4-amino-4,6-dideoxygalactose transaminase
VAVRKQTVSKLLEALDGRAESSQNRWIIPPVGGEASYLRLPVLLDPAARTLADSKPALALGVMPGYPRPLSDLPAMAGMRVGQKSRCPGAEKLSRCLVTLPTHSRITDRDIDRLVAWVLTLEGGMP